MSNQTMTIEDLIKAGKMESSVEISIEKICCSKYWFF